MNVQEVIKRKKEQMMSRGMSDYQGMNDYEKTLATNGFRDQRLLDNGQRLNVRQYSGTAGGKVQSVSAPSIKVKKKITIKKKSLYDDKLNDFSDYVKNKMSK
jgi:hypothetical protein